MSNTPLSTSNHKDGIKLFGAEIDYYQFLKLKIYKIRVVLESYLVVILVIKFFPFINI